MSNEELERICQVLKECLSNAEIENDIGRIDACQNESRQTECILNNAWIIVSLISFEVRKIGTKIFNNFNIYVTFLLFSTEEFESRNHFQMSNLADGSAQEFRFRSKI